jgi:hypothetical protein
MFVTYYNDISLVNEIIKSWEKDFLSFNTYNGLSVMRDLVIFIKLYFDGFEIFLNSFIK